MRTTRNIYQYTLLCHYREKKLYCIVFLVGVLNKRSSFTSVYLEIGNRISAGFVIGFAFISTVSVLLASLPSVP